MTTPALRILFVDDDPDTRSVMARLLAMLGHQAKTASDATSAIRLCDQEEFDLLISDIGLPDKSGLELMSAISARRPIHGIAMSGYGMEEDRAASLRAGFREHLLKPVGIDAIKEALARIPRNN